MKNRASAVTRLPERTCNIQKRKYRIWGTEILAKRKATATTPTTTGKNKMKTKHTFLTGFCAHRRKLQFVVSSLYNMYVIYSERLNFKTHNPLRKRREVDKEEEEADEM